MTVIMGVAALAVDIGTLYSAQAELQRAADASALAAASELVGESSDPQADAEEAANKFANLNQVLKKNVGIDTGGDLEFGHATLDGVRNLVGFTRAVLRALDVEDRVAIDWHPAGAPAGAERLWRLTVERVWRRRAALPYDWTFGSWAPTSLATGVW